MNSALATVGALTVCSKGSRHNNLHNPATLENQRVQRSRSDSSPFRNERGDRNREAGGRGKRGESGVAQLEGEKAAHGMKTALSLLSVSHEILPSPNFCSTKRALALEVLSREDLHNERSLMKE